MSKHKMTAWAPFGLQPDSLECVIEYTYSPGSPAVYYGTPQPASRSRSTPALPSRGRPTLLAASRRSLRWPNGAARCRS